MAVTTDDGSDDHADGWSRPTGGTGPTPRAEDGAPASAPTPRRRATAVGRPAPPRRPPVRRNERPRVAATTRPAGAPTAARAADGRRIALASWPTLVAVLGLAAWSASAWATDATAAARSFALFGVLALVAGAVVSTTTDLPDRLGAVPAILPAGAIAAIGAAALVGLDLDARPFALAVWVAVVFVAALDLRLVPRLDVLVVLSGALLVPRLGASASGLRWGAGWFVGMLLARWLLTADRHAALDRVGGGSASTRRPADLARLVAAVAVVGAVLGGGATLAAGVLHRPSVPNRAGNVDIRVGLPQVGRDVDEDLDGIATTTTVVDVSAQTIPATTPVVDDVTVPSEPTEPEPDREVAPTVSDRTHATDAGPNDVDRRLAVAALVALVVAALGAMALRERRRRRLAANRTWAEEQVVRLERLGGRHALPRRTPLSVLAYSHRLAAAVDGGEERLVTVGEILDRALYGTTAPGLDDRRLAVDTITTVTAERPRPTWLARRRRAVTTDLAEPAGPST